MQNDMILQIRHLLSSRPYFISVILMFVIFASTYSLITPAYESPDEESHYYYIRTAWSENPSSYVTTQPLYYAILGGIYNVVPHYPKLTDSDFVVDTSYPFVDQTRFHHGFNDIFPFKGEPLTIHILRLFSILFGVVTIIFVYKIAKIVFTPNNGLPLFAMAFVALIPTFIWMGSVLNSDILVWTLSTIAIYYLIKFVTYNYKLKSLILFSIFVGLAISSKENGYVLYLLLMIVLLYLLFTKKISIKHFFRNVIIFMTTSTLSGGWSIPLRMINAIDLNNLNIHKIIQAGLSSSILGSTTQIDLSAGFQRLTSLEFLHNRLIEFAISGMGQNVIWISQNYYYFFDILLIVAFVGICIVLAKKKTLDGIKLQNSHLLILFCGPVLILSIMAYHWLYDEVGLARYTFPMISSFGLLFSIGFYRCVNFKKYLKVLIFIPLIFLAVANLQDISTIRTELGGHTSVIDSDSDGISDNVDTEPSVFSNVFNDSKIGGASSGYIVNRDTQMTGDNGEFYTYHKFNQTFMEHYLKAGDQTLHISESLNPKGIHINDEFPGGAEPAQVNICNNTSTLYLHPTDDLVFSCNANGETIRTNVNYVMATFMGGKGFIANANIYQGNELDFDPKTHRFTALDINNEKITVFYNKTETTLDPGESKIIKNLS